MPYRDGLPGRFLLSGLGVLIAAGNLSAAIIESVEVRGTRARLLLETRAGEVFSPAALSRDVRRLWKTGSFDDIRVESNSEGDHVRLVFRVAERPRFLLRDVRFEPPGERREFTLKKGNPVTEVAARDAGRSIAKQLVADGFPEAHVQVRLVPAGAGQADFEVRVERGPRVRFGGVDIEGVLLFDAAHLRKALKATAPRRWLPGVPGVWKGWVRRAPYSPERIESDVAALRSRYIAEGYLAAKVGLEEVRIEENRAHVAIRVDAGPRYRIENASMETPQDSLSIAASGREMFPKLCRCLLAERSRAEREGRLDFNVRLEWKPLDAPVTQASTAPRTPDGSGAANAASGSVSVVAPEDRRARLVARIERGPQYRVGRIEFRGNHNLRDATLRRALAIGEGDWLDPGAIRMSLARLSKFEGLEPLSETDVRAQPGGEDDTVDLAISVRERRRGRWTLSGPLGPVSWFGPLRFAVDARLPPWGRGILDLSTWLGAFGVVSYADPVASILSGEAKALWRPFVALRRPLLPGQQMTSGFLLSPSLGWREHLVYSGLVHVRSAVDRALEPAGQGSPPLAAAYGRREQDDSTAGEPGIFVCTPRKSRLDWLQSGAKLLLDLAIGVS